MFSFEISTGLFPATQRNKLYMAYDVSKETMNM